MTQHKHDKDRDKDKIVKRKGETGIYSKVKTHDGLGMRNANDSQFVRGSQGLPTTLKETANTGHKKT
ncbi:unnamed protein product [Prunus armeniaca]